MLWFLPQNCNVINIHEKCFLHMVYGQFKQIKSGEKQILEYCVLMLQKEYETGKIQGRFINLPLEGK